MFIWYSALVLEFVEFLVDLLHSELRLLVPAGHLGPPSELRQVYEGKLRPVGVAEDVVNVLPQSTSLHVPRHEVLLGLLLLPWHIQVQLQKLMVRVGYLFFDLHPLITPVGHEEVDLTALVALHSRDQVFIIVIHQHQVQLFCQLLGLPPLHVEVTSDYDWNVIIILVDVLHDEDQQVLSLLYMLVFEVHSNNYELLVKDSF